MNVEFSIEDKYPTFELENERESYIKGVKRYRCLLISCEKESIAIAMTTEQVKELVDTINEKLKEDNNG
jgi:nitrogen regulatory protein PII